MKKTLQTLIAIATFGAVALSASAQPAPKLLVVDMAKLYDNHYKTIEQNAKIQADDQKAQDEVARLNKEGQGIVDEYKALVDQSNNPTATADAKSKAQNDAQKKYQEIQAKQQEVQTFIQNTRNSLQQRLNTFRSLMLEEISKTATEVAKRHGATVLIDKAGPSFIGISNIIYTDPAYDITDEVMKEINKDRPANAPTAPVAAPAATPSAPAATPSTEASPMIRIPGAPAKK